MNSARIAASYGGHVAVVIRIGIFKRVELTTINLRAGYVSRDVVGNGMRDRAGAIGGISVGGNAGHVSEMVGYRQIRIEVSAFPLPVKTTPKAGLIDAPFFADPIARLLILLKRIIRVVVHDEVRARC